MKFAHPWWLFGSTVALVVAALLIVGGIFLLRAVRRFGEEERIEALVTARAGSRRAVKGVLLVVAVALAFVALAQPQYGRGTRLIPATNLDVVIALDYSKSMYARDVRPSRVARAKSEVGQLIADLPGARFGAVGFAGEPIAFPLTSDGGAIAQFFRQLTPNDMPIGGTAIARALEASRELLRRDPTSKKHRKVILLVTDGEDLEGNPVSVARAASNEDIAIHVVQIGGRTPEPIPEVDDSGDVIGMRTDDDGRPITTSLSAGGEAQLAKIAETTGGTVVRAERGSTGIQEISARLKKFMTEELSEKVETVYADVYVYPLGLAILLLLIETFIGESRARKRPTLVAPPARRRRPKKRPRKKRPAAAAAGAALLGVLCAMAINACSRSPDELFVRNAPTVDEAIEAYDGGDASAAMRLLSNYLSTGRCEAGQIGAPSSLTERPNASFDLGLALFELGERFGRRFGEEESFGDAGMTPEEEAHLASRSEQVDCALKIVTRIAHDRDVPLDLRARAHYLAGNLEFLRRQYRAAVEHYDRALRLVPGLPEDAGDDGVGRDAAWNRAIALRRIEEEEQNRQDAAPDAPPDGSPDAGQDAGDDGGDGGDGGGGEDSGGDSGSNQDDQDGGDPNEGPDGGAPDSGSQDNQRPDSGQPPPPEEPPPQSANQDERTLDMLEMAPTLQQHNAKNRALQRRVRGMVDK